MSFRFEEFSEFGGPTPTDSIAKQINDRMQELGDDWVPVQVLGIETPKEEFTTFARAARSLVFFITRDELAGESGEIIAQFQSSFIGGKPTLLDGITGTLAISKGGTGQTTKTPAFDALAPGTTKGDIIAHNGTDHVREPVGANGQVLTADSAKARGVKWATAGGGGQTYAEGLHSARPVAGTSGSEWFSTDIGVYFKDNGTTWTVVSDPWGFKFFEDEGFLPDNVEFSGLTTIPTEDATILPASGTWTITDSEGKLAWGATTGNSVVGWDFSALRSDVLLVFGGVHVGDQQAIGIFMQDAVLSGTEINDGYLLHVDTADGKFNLYKESAGFTSLVSEASITLDRSTGSEMIGMALHYKDSTGALTCFVKKGDHQWIPFLSTTDSTFTTMKTVGVRSNNNANKTVRISCPFMVFSTT